MAPRILVAVASYGRANDRHLTRLIREYRSMSFDVDIVVFSNLDKQLDNIEVIVGLPDKNPWTLPFAHKKVFYERANDYDLFVYSEDDVLITERNLHAFLEVSGQLAEDEIVGFVRYELGAGGTVTHPDVHSQFHWDVTSVVSRGPYVLASLTNDHAACYVLTQNQLKKAIESQGFLVGPHEWRYDLLCSAATDPYTQCGFRKLVPISHFENFSVHHLSNKYTNRLGIDAVEMRQQIDALMPFAAVSEKPSALIPTHTLLWHEMYSKDYYEPISEDVFATIPAQARTFLSIGCGWGATERRLAKKGHRVVAAPLDPVVSSGAAAAGIEMVYGDISAALKKLNGQVFDCVLLLNFLHLHPNPQDILAILQGHLSSEGVVIIQTQNLASLPNIWKRVRYRSRFRGYPRYELTGVHPMSPALVYSWCRKIGLTIDAVIASPHKKFLTSNCAVQRVATLAPGFVKLFLADSFVIRARRDRPSQR